MCGNFVLLSGHVANPVPKGWGSSQAKPVSCQHHSVDSYTEMPSFARRVGRSMPHISGQAEKFLQLRRTIGDDTTVLDKFDDQLRGMTQFGPDRAADIVQALANSDITDDRDVAAIYVKYLLAARQDRAKTSSVNYSTTQTTTSDSKPKTASTKQWRKG